MAQKSLSTLASELTEAVRNHAALERLAEQAQREVDAASRSIAELEAKIGARSKRKKVSDD